MNTKAAVALVALISILAVVLIVTNKTAVPNQLTAPATQTAQKIQNATVTVTKDGFSPQTLTISAGTRVIWLNQSGKTVTVNSAVHPTHLVYPPLNLGAFPNGSSVQLVFSKPGAYQYHNHYDPSQTGTIIVK